MNRQTNHSGTFIMLSKNSPSYSYVEDDNRTENVGNVVMNVSYDPFGNIISGKLTGEYGFSTKPLVDGVDWYYYGFRYYDPVTGRWPSRDPIGEYGGLNLYAMVRNQSINHYDILGLSKFCLPWIPTLETEWGEVSRESGYEAIDRRWAAATVLESISSPTVITTIFTLYRLLDKVRENQYRRWTRVCFDTRDCSSYNENKFRSTGKSRDRYEQTGYRLDSILQEEIIPRIA